MVDVGTLYAAVLDGEAEAARAETQQQLDAGIPAETILNEALVAAMKEVGRRFESGEYFLPEMLVSAQAMKASLVLLRPVLTERKVAWKGRVVLGTVQGDLHDIGKNLVAMMLEGAGFEVLDLGVDVPPEKFVQAAADAQVVGLSALLTTTMPAMSQVIRALTAAGVRERVKVVIGGAPVTQAFADEVGADGYSPDASSTVRKVQELLGPHARTDQ
jgi:5-methyltetrahydrofolate--homocysteine methyltransferase